MTLPLRLMTLHFSHMGFTEGLTFIVNYLLNVNALWPRIVLVPRPLHWSKALGMRLGQYGRFYLHKINCALLGTPGNAASGEVVRRHLNGHLVTGQDADEVHTQLAGNMGQNNMAITNVHMESGIGKGLGHDSLQFDHIVFCQA